MGIPIEVWPFEIVECGETSPDSVFHVVQHPKSIGGVLKNQPAIPPAFDKLELLPKTPEGHQFFTLPPLILRENMLLSRTLLGEMVQLEKQLPENIYVKIYEDKIVSIYYIIYFPMFKM